MGRGMPRRRVGSSGGLQRLTDSHRAHPGKLAVYLIASAQLMIVLDITIVNVAIPSIQRALHFSATSLTWVVDAYTLVFGGLLLLGGRSGDIFGRRKMFMIGVLLFAGASFAGGFAQDSAMLITARALQGIGGAIASPTALALIASNFEDHRQRTEALSIYAAASAAGASLGLVAGALLTQYLSWRWVFFVNTPIAIVLAVFAPVLLRESRKQEVPADFLGAVLSVVAVAGIVYGLIHSAASGWTSPISLGAFAVGFGGLGAFILRERSAATPLLELDIFANRKRSAGYAVMFLVIAAQFSLWFFLTQYFQDVLGYSPLKTGFAFLPMTVAAMLIARNGPRFIRRIGIFPPMIYGPIAVAVALYMLSRLGMASDYWTSILPALLIQATGLGATFASVFPASMTKVTQREAGLSSAMVMVAQQVGGTLGLSVLATVSVAAATTKLHDLAANVPHLGPAHARVLVDLAGWMAGFKVGAVIGLLGVVAALLGARRERAGEVEVLAAGAD